MADWRELGRDVRGLAVAHGPAWLLRNVPNFVGRQILRNVHPIAGQALDAYDAVNRGHETISQARSGNWDRALYNYARLENIGSVKRGFDELGNLVSGSKKEKLEETPVVPKEEPAVAKESVVPAVAANSDMAAPAVTSMSPGGDGGGVEVIPEMHTQQVQTFKFNNTCQMSFGSFNQSSTYTPATYVDGELTNFGVYNSNWFLLPTATLSNYVTPLQLQRMLAAGARRFRFKKLGLSIYGQFMIETQATGQTTTLSNDRPPIMVFRDNRHLWPLCPANNTTPFNFVSYESSTDNVLPRYYFNHISTVSSSLFLQYLPDQVRVGGVELMSPGTPFGYSWDNPSPAWYDLTRPLTTSASDVSIFDPSTAVGFVSGRNDYTVDVPNPVTEGPNYPAVGYDTLSQVFGTRHGDGPGQIMMRFPLYFSSTEALNYKTYFFVDFTSEFEVEYHDYSYARMYIDPITLLPAEERTLVNNTGRWLIERGRAGRERYPRSDDINDVPGTWDVIV